jgi:hypothetical protein
MSTIASTNPETGVTHLRPAPLRQRPWVVLGVALLIAVGIVRIVSTYHVFNHTIDEGAHLACGIQWFGGSYTYDRKHTPIARISMALLPYMDGMRGFGNESYWQEGVLLLSTGGRYWHNLTLARVAILPYFALAIVVIFLWSRRLYGYPTALLAAGIFSMLPVILAHSGLATTDIALTACFIIAVYAFTLWLEAPKWRTAAGLGLATGLAVATKLSTVAFLPATVLGILPLYFMSRGRAPAGDDEARWGMGSLRSLLRSAIAVAICAFIVIWAAYRFSHATIKEISPGPDRVAARVFGASSSTARAVRVLTSTVQLPAPELLEGLRELRDINSTHVRSYLFGQVKPGGWWYFYPVAIAVKTPLAVLLLAGIGAASLGAGWFRRRMDWQRLVPLVGFLAPLAIAAPSNLDIGVRHVMPVFAFLSMLAAVGAVRLWNGAPADGDAVPERGMAWWGRRAAVVILLAWCIVSSARAHPDYLAYFNELGGKHPENILVISDLDWGQDLTRLATYSRERNIKHVSIAYDGFYDPEALGLPDSEHILCTGSGSGWVAVEVRRLRLYPECYGWLSQRNPITTVGKTMLIYYIPESPAPGPVPAASRRKE